MAAPSNIKFKVQKRGAVKVWVIQRICQNCGGRPSDKDNLLVMRALRKGGRSP